MGINSDGSWDGLGDPNEVVDEVTDDTGGTPTLSDQSTLMSTTRDNLDEINTEAQSALQGVTQGEVNYSGTDADTIKSESKIDKGSSYITPEGTVAGQLEKLLDSNNSYMKNAERRSNEKAASLGLLGSSMAVGAGQRAMVESVMPVAQQDAKTFATAQLAEQGVYNEVSRMKAESDLTAAAREHIYDIDTEKQKMASQMDIISSNAKLAGNTEAQLALTKMQTTWDAETKVALAELDAELQMKVQSQEINAREREYASTSSSQIMAAAYGTINDLMGNADFMAGYADNPEGLSDTFNNFINLAKSQVKFIGASAGLTEEYADPETGYLGFIGEWYVDSTWQDPDAIEPEVVA